MSRHPLLGFMFSVLLVLGICLSVWAGEGRGKQGDLYQGTPADPAIQTMVDAVSSDSILSYLQHLVGFYTRHSNSDTTSADTGIGAARRYIKSKFEQWRAQNGGALQPSFFWFTETICGITGLHANVLATLPGTMPQAADRFFIVSGHMDDRTFGRCDATSFAPGANDDGSGTAASIEIARVMSGFSFDASLIFMTVTGEDEGLVGSTAYANWAKANNMRIDGMLTNDVVGNIVADDSTIDSTSVRHFSEGPSTSPSRQLARYFKLHGEQYVPDMTVNLIPSQDRPGRGGDHIPFNDNGYAAVRFTEPAERLAYQHSNLDLIEHMHPPYTAQIAKLSVAGLASLALAPATPTAPLKVLDVGNGTDLKLSWTPSNVEPDFAGYRVAIRPADSLFYTRIDCVGNVTTYTLMGLEPGKAVFISYSAVDSAGHESIFSQEVLATPRVEPTTPQGFDATSTPNGVRLVWQKNRELDLAGYTITRTAPDQSQITVDLDTSATSFLDTNLQPHTLYQYTLQARDVDGNLSLPTAPLLGQLATHDLGILVLDYTKDGPGNNLLRPTDEQVDTYYDALLQGFPVAGEWDIADSLAFGKQPTDADLAVYSTILAHTDVRPPKDRMANDTTTFRKYLQNGGKMLFSGWGVISSVSGIAQVGSFGFPPGDFIHDFMKVDTFNTSTLFDFHGGDPVASGYPPFGVDSLKVPATFNQDLNTMEVFEALVDEPQTEVLYTYRSSNVPPSSFHGKPVAIRHVGTDPRVVVLDFPLYYMFQDKAKQILQKALNDLGEVTGIQDSHRISGIARRFELMQNFPNPFNPETQIEYRLPVTSEVRISVYNIRGQEVARLVDGQQAPGVYRVRWRGTDRQGVPVASGIYFYRMEARARNGSQRHFQQVRKLVLIR